MAIQNAQVVRFATFEVDLRAGELRKGGIKLKLGGQPFQVLAILLERPGEVVTREELQKRLWPDTFVDVDHNLNTAINKIREALGDSAENSRFVETLARRGYRFIGAVNGAEPRSLIFPAAVGLVGIVGITAVLFALNVHGWRDRLFVHAARPRIQALAVIPFANLSGDPEQEYFADGMTEEIITKLGEVNAPRVISRQSMMQYKGSKKPLQEIARELNVDAVLEGAVERSGSRVRVRIHLDQVSPESQLWAKQYDRDIHDVLQVQDEIARTVTDEIRVKLTPEGRTRLTTAHNVSPEAHDNYLRGQFFLYRDLEEVKYEQAIKRNLQTAIGYFRQAIEKDPDYAAAYVGLAETYIGLGTEYRGGDYPKDVMPQAKAAAEKALQLDPSLGRAHFSLAQVLELYDWNWSEADKEYRLALKLDPNYAFAHLQYGRYLQALGRNDEAIRHVNYALELDPFDFKTKDLAAFVTWATRQYDLAIKQFERLGDDLGLGWSYREKKMYPEAVAALERSVNDTRRHPFAVGSLACVYGLAGKNREAMELINELKERDRQGYVSGFVFAYAHLGLGEKDQALTWLERAYEDRDELMVYIKAEPTWDALRSEPRFQALLRRMNFPK